MHTNSDFSLLFYIPFLVLGIFVLVASCKIYVKAGCPWWNAIVPFYNIYILLKMIGRPAWWLLLTFIPLVNIVVSILVAIGLGKSFGKSTTFSVFGLIIFPYVGYLILGFGKDKYIGPQHAPIIEK